MLKIWGKLQIIYWDDKLSLPIVEVSKVL